VRPFFLEPAVISTILVLAALLNLEDSAPKMMSPHKSIQECLVAAQAANHEHRLELAQPDNVAVGLRFVCLKLVSEV
jgi:hypothetical protein